MWKTKSRISEKLKNLIKLRMAKSNSKKSGTENFEYKDKIKVLCLHGYRQTGDGFKSKIGSFRKFVNKYVEFTFITAPHQAPALENEELKEDHKSWWFNKDDGTFKGTNEFGPAIGFEESLKLVEKAWEADSYQGLLGFSQGACLIGLICSLAERNLTTIKPNFVVLSSGFKSKSLAHKNFYEDVIKIPSLHIYGDTDEIIPKDLSLELQECFDETTRTIVNHSGGHYFAATVQQKQIYINYFQDRLQEYLEKKVLDEDFEKSKNLKSD